MYKNSWKLFTAWSYHAKNLEIKKPIAFSWLAMGLLLGEVAQVVSMSGGKFTSVLAWTSSFIYSIEVTGQESRTLLLLITCFLDDSRFILYDTMF